MAHKSYGVFDVVVRRLTDELAIPHEVTGGHLPGMRPTTTPIANRGRARTIALAVVANVAIAIVYVSVARLSLQAATEHRLVSSIWLPAGVALFGMLRYGLGLWPGVAIAAMLVNQTGGTDAITSSVVAAGEVLEAVAGAALIRRWTDGRWSLDSVRDVLTFGGFGALLATTIAASVGVVALMVSGAIPVESAAPLWLVWWTGDMVGILVVTPFLITWTAPELRDVAPPRRVEAAITFLALILVTDGLFAHPWPLIFALYPAGIWVAWRFGTRGAATATVVVALVAVFRTLSGYGPFTTLTPTENLFALQLFLGLFGVKCLVFAAARREVLESQAQLQHLSRLLITAQEDERRRIAREIHDELGQALTVVKMGLAQVFGRANKRSSMESERRVALASETLDGAIAAVKRIILRLRPGVLDNLGTLAAIEHEVQQFREQTGLPTTLVLPPETFEIDPQRSTVVYRTVQEALTNVMRHAQATAVDVRMRADDGHVVIEVADDGRGMPDDTRDKPRSMGILGMRERAAAFGGRVEFIPAVSGGTTVRLTLPYDVNWRVSA